MEKRLEPRRNKVNPKRRMLGEDEVAAKQAHLAKLGTTVQYGGNPEHKRNPGDFELIPPCVPRPGKTLCDDVGIFSKAEALKLLRRGLELGFVSDRFDGEWPNNVWMVTDKGDALEAQIEAKVSTTGTRCLTTTRSVTSYSGDGGRTVNELSFTVDWTGLGKGAPEEIATRALFAIEAGGVALTRNQNSWSRSVSDRVHVSVYPAALWLAAGWWRLCYEAPRSATTRDYDWRATHELAAAGQGYLWPSLCMVPDGEFVFLQSHQTPTTSKQPIRYLEEVEVPVSLVSFQRACEGLIDIVVERLRQERVASTRLEGLWQEVKAERGDHSTTRRRRLEAMMHCDPDEAPTAGLNALDRLANEAGLDAANELAGVLRRQDAIAALDRLKAAVANRDSTRGTWRPDADAGLLARCRALAAETSLLPWQRGLQAARALRAAWQLGEKRVDSGALEARLQLPPNTLDVVTIASTLPVTLAVQDGSDLRWLLRSRHPRARRFEAARLLGDLLGSPQGDAWHPATDLHTARQKFQRAFAAEFLCPVEGLREVLGDDRSEDGIVAAAEHFAVSELAVEHQVQNHLDRKDT